MSQEINNNKNNLAIYEHEIKPTCRAYLVKWKMDINEQAIENIVFS